jgi:hypothetical protein
MECFGQAADLLKGVITDSEFKVQLSTERANYLAVLKRMR